MKRLFSLLLGCTIITGALVSCSSSDSSSDSVEQTTPVSSAVSSVTTEQKTTEPATETATEKTTTAKKTTAAPKTTEPETTTEPFTVDVNALKGGDITGSWLMSEDERDGLMSFAPDGTLDMLFDMSSILSFNGKKVKVYGDEVLDVEFDGITARAVYHDQECFVIERISGETSPDNMDGKYRIIGGFMNDTNGGNLIVIRNGNTLFSSGDMYTYKTSGSKLTITMKREGGSDIDTEETYGVEGDKLTIVDANGDFTVLTRSTDNIRVDNFLGGF